MALCLVIVGAIGVADVWVGCGCNPRCFFGGGLVSVFRERSVVGILGLGLGRLGGWACSVLGGCVLRVGFRLCVVWWRWMGS